MKVSIIITAYNVGKYLAEAIESALAQTYQNIEIIAINDGSTDNSAEMLDQYKDKIRVFHQENKGLSATLNKALKEATGEMIGFLDGDDIFVSDKIEKQLKEFDKNQALEATFGEMEQFLSPEFAHQSDRYNFQKGKLAFQSKTTLLIKKEAFEKYGLFPQVDVLDFVKWFDKAKGQGIIFNQTEDMVVYRRIRENSLSQSTAYYPQLLQYLRERINQKRNAV